jgi:hypothetical protein
MFRSRIVRVGLAVTISLLAAGVLSSEAAAVSATSPHIVAKPNNLMVNSNTTLTGSGFPAKTRFGISECSKTSWVVPQNPCVNANKIVVTTDSNGHFVHTFRVAVCGGKHGKIVTSQICYIGQPHPEGKDTVSLLGPAKVIVAYP